MRYIQNYLEPTTKAVKVLIVDDKSLVRDGFVTMLDGSREVRVVGEASSGQEALLLVREVWPDLVLMDISMPPGIDGLETTRQLKRLHPKCEVIMLTFLQGQEYLRQALYCGASGYLTKEVGREELLRAIQTVIKGGTQIQPEMLRTFIEETVLAVAQKEAQTFTQEKPAAKKETKKSKKPIDPLLPHRFSPRERQVLQLVSRGLSNTDIAAELGIKIPTVRTHVGSIFRKLEVRDRTTAAVVAQRLGILS